MLERIYTVTQLNEYVHGLLGRDPLLHSIRVQGEISGFKKHSSGHLYFSLKDNEALVRCVMFRSAAQTLRFIPKDGTQAVLLAEASIYQRDGQFQLYVQAMEPQGEGELYRNFLLLKAKLEAKGYFDSSKKKALPLLPRKVGIITSGTGAALQDIIQIIRRRYPRLDIVVYPVLVQGEGAAREIAAAIRYMNLKKSASVLIVGRGGGSMEDLWAFNEEKLILAIYESTIPIVSAVGHETDYTLADFAADFRAPTPSAAAELCVPEYAALSQYVDSLCQRLLRTYQAGIRVKKDKVSNLLNTRGFIAAEHMVKGYKNVLCNDMQNLDLFASRIFANNNIKLENLMQRLHTLSPMQMFARGFAYLRNERGKTISTIKDLKRDMKVMLTLRDGEAKAIIHDIMAKE